MFTGKQKYRDVPDTEFAGYPADLKARYRISGNGRIPDIRPFEKKNRSVNNKF